MISRRDDNIAFIEDDYLFTMFGKGPYSDILVTTCEYYDLLNR